MAEILTIRRKTLNNQSINQYIYQENRAYIENDMICFSHAYCNILEVTQHIYLTFKVQKIS